MSDLIVKKRTLADLGCVSRGRSRHRPRNDDSLYGGNYPFFQTGDVKAANFNLSKYTQTYNEKGLAQSKLWDEGTLCITIAANIAETAILAIKGCFPDSIVGFTPNQELADVRFIKYYVDSIKIGMQNVSRGTTQDNLSVDKLLGFDFDVPPIAEQKRIAGILSAYDDLIENNFRRIKILEEMAQSLYREWFVHFRFPGHQTTEFQDSPLGAIPVGWEVKKLGEVASVNEEALRSNNVPSEIHYIDIKSVSTGCIDEVTTMPFSDAPSRARRVVKHGDVIWSTVRPNRRSFSVIINPIENLIASTGLAVLTPKRIPSTYLYQATTTQDFTSYLVNHATGAAYPAVNATTFKNAPIIVPSQDILNSFDELASALTRQINTLLNKNQNLRKTRDLLLPRLLTPNH